MKDIIIYTDGACKYNPGPGGYAAIIAYEKETITDENNIVKKIVSGSKETTNNIMELTAIMKDLEYVYKVLSKPENISKVSKEKPLNIILYSDSQYSLSGILEWHINWEKKNYKNVKNEALWKELLEYKKLLEKIEGINLKFLKVKGHSGDTYNEMVDKLASDEALKYGNN